MVEELSGEFRNLKTFATLSPIPGFRSWLDEKLAEDQPGLLSDEEAASLGSAMPAPSGEQALAAHPGEARLVAGSRAAQDRRAGAGAAVRALSAGGVRTAASARATRWRISICPTARGWSGSTCSATPRRRAHKESATLMVNYLYDPAKIEDWHEDYAGEGKRNASTTVRRLARGWH